MQSNRLVSIELEKIFVELITLSWDADLRKRFEKAGIGSTEVRVLSPNTYQGGFMETLPTEKRVEHYFETIDWTNREDIRKILPIINHALIKLGSYHLSDIIQRSAKVFERAGLYFNGAKLVRKASQSNMNATIQ